MDGTRPYGEEVARACLPEILLVRDVAVALQLTPSGARQAIRRGDCGPYTRIGRRLAVLRESFLLSITDRTGPFQLLPPTANDRGMRL